MGITVTFNVDSLKVDPVKWDSKIEVELLPLKMYPFPLSLGYLLKYYSGKFVSVVKNRCLETRKCIHIPYYIRDGMVFSI